MALARCSHIAVVKVHLTFEKTQINGRPSHLDNIQSTMSSCNRYETHTTMPHFHYHFTCLLFLLMIEPSDVWFLRWSTVTVVDTEEMKLQIVS